MGREGEQLLALTGPCSCSSCGGVLLVPPAGQEQAEPQREDMSQVRGHPAHQARLPAGQESGQWLGRELQPRKVACRHVSCGPHLPMGGNSPLAFKRSDAHVVITVFSCATCSLQCCYSTCPSGWRGSFHGTRLQQSQLFFFPLGTSETLKQSSVWTPSSKNK